MGVSGASQRLVAGAGVVPGRGRGAAADAGRARAARAAPGAGAARRPAAAGLAQVLVQAREQTLLLEQAVRRVYVGTASC